MKFECKKCGHQWKSRKEEKEHPVACPRCKRYDWKEEKEE